MAGVKGMKRGRASKRMTDGQRRYWKYPNKMLDTEKEDKASAKIETKNEKQKLAEKKEELIKMYKQRYGVVPKDLQC